MIENQSVRSLDIAATDNAILILSPAVWSKLVELLPDGENRNPSILQVVVPWLGPCVAIKERDIPLAVASLNTRTIRINSRTDNSNRF